MRGTGCNKTFLVVGSIARTWRSMNAVPRRHSAAMLTRTRKVIVHFNCPSGSKIFSVPEPVGVYCMRLPRGDSASLVWYIVHTCAASILAWIRVGPDPESKPP